MRKNAGKEAGLSLLEVVIAGVILVLICLMVMGILLTTTNIVDRDSRAAGLQHRGRTLVEFCRDQWYTGLFREATNPLPTQPYALGIFDQNTSVRYQVPVRQHKDPVTGVLTGAMDFGYTTNMGKDDDEFVVNPVTKAKVFMGPKTCIVRFEADEVLWESRSATPASVSQITPQTGTPTTLPPLPTLPATSSGSTKATILNADANKNGNKNNVFVRGKLKKYVLSSVATGQKLLTTESLDDSVVLGVDASGQFIGRIDFTTGATNPTDSDGVYRGDWLFRYIDANGQTVTGYTPGTTAVGITVTVWHGDWDEYKKGYLLWRDRETIRFRNPQQ